MSDALTFDASGNASGDARGVAALTGEWRGEFGLPAFDEIEVEAFGPAFAQAMAEARANIDAIASNPEAPTFENTIVAMETAEATLDRVAALFFNIAGAHTNDALEALRSDLSPKLSAHGSATMLNAALFARVDRLMAAIDDLGLTAEQARVLTLYHRMFRRAGANLEGADRDGLATLMQRLASLGTAFGQNVLADEKSWEMALAPEDLEGLPEFVVESAAAAARERGRTGHVITLSRSLIVPFLQFSPRRDLRERA